MGIVRRIQPKLSNATLHSHNFPALTWIFD
jgi:hypothetical protein